MENTQGNKLDKVSSSWIGRSDIPLAPLYIPAPKQLGRGCETEEKGVTYMFLQSLSSPAVDTEKPGCSRQCNHEVLKPPLPGGLNDQVEQSPWLTYMGHVAWERNRRFGIYVSTA